MIARFTQSPYSSFDDYKRWMIEWYTDSCDFGAFIFDTTKFPGRIPKWVKYFKFVFHIILKNNSIYKLKTYPVSINFEILKSFNIWIFKFFLGDT